MKRALFAVVVLLGTVSGCGTGPVQDATPTPTTPPVFAVYGSLEMAITDTTYDAIARVCAGDGGYDDIHAGAQVVVTGADGRTVAIGELGQGKMQNSGTDATCEWRFTVPDVPPGDGFYGVEVTHRGQIQFSESELRTPIGLTLG